MFGFLRRLFGRGGARRRDAIFRLALPDGTERWYDPMEVRLRLDEALATWADKVDELTDGSKPLPPGTSDGLVEKRAARLDATAAELAVAVSTAFRLPPLTEGGAGYAAAERLDVLAAFLAYCAEVNKKTRPLAPPPAGTDSAGGNSPAKKSSGCT